MQRTAQRVGGCFYRIALNNFWAAQSTGHLTKNMHFASTLRDRIVLCKDVCVVITTPPVIFYFGVHAINAAQTCYECYKMLHRMLHARRCRLGLSALPFLKTVIQSLVASMLFSCFTAGACHLLTCFYVSLPEILQTIY